VPDIRFPAFDHQRPLMLRRAVHGLAISGETFNGAGPAAAV